MKYFIYTVILLMLLCGCGSFGKKENEGKKDIRIVCVSKHLTEMLFALDKGKDIVARDLTSTYPESAKEIPTVGYHRMLNTEGIIATNPDVVIHANDIGPEIIIPQLTKAGVNIKTFGAASSFDSAKIVLKQLGEYFHTTTKADSIIRKMDADMGKVIAAQKELKDTPTVMVIHYGQANNIFFVMSGRKGAADKMIELAGGKPATYDAKGARQISAEAVAVANPDIIIATDFGFDKMGSAEKFKEVPGVALTNAAKNNRIYRFEEHDLVYFGPRSAENILLLMKLIHQQHASKL